MRAKTSAEGGNIGRFGRYYGELPKQQYQQRIIYKPPFTTRQQVLGMYSEKDVDLNDVEQYHAKNSSENNLLYGLFQFTRPYTIIGTILSIASISTLALSSWTQVSPVILWEVFKAVVPVIFMNIYISGINQVYDVEIDKVNKPYLPLASGVMSMKLGTGIVATSLITSFTLGMRYGSPAAMVALLCLCLIGSLYSIELPFMRWKRSPFLTAVTIIVMRALSIPLGYFVHMQKYVLGKPIVLSRAIIFTCCFMFLFSIVVSMAKDIPDVEGDKMHGFTSFSVSLGQERVLGHFSLATILMYRALQVNHLDNFYMFVWKLFYTEYLLIPFMR
ncbi:homogentisate phytyltransferase 1, chloroplastic-like isoform X2 [Henckelia pumila]|uniref:homogentisate phytyltransferase 1, chloroplastic-like isoform X2 n=1 Tax=Henckelia pumila TaxID=405737 RepID=UPI003C6E66FE